MVALAGRRCTIAADALRAVHARGSRRGVVRGGRRRAGRRRRRGPRRGDGRAAPATAFAAAATRQRTRSSARSARRPSDSGTTSALRADGLRRRGAVRHVRRCHARERCRWRRVRPARSQARAPAGRRSSWLAGSTATPAGSTSCRASSRTTPPSCWRAPTARPASAGSPRRRLSGPGRLGRRAEGPDGRLCYPLARRGVRVVDGAALEKRCAKAPWVRIPPSPPLPTDSRHAAAVLAPVERSPSGLGRRTGNAVWGNPSRVRIPPSPPASAEPRYHPRAVLGGELAVPCTCNPLQQG